MLGALRLGSGSGMAEASCAHSCLLRAFFPLIYFLLLSPVDKASNGPTPSRNVPGESRKRKNSRHAREERLVEVGDQGKEGREMAAAAAAGKQQVLSVGLASGDFACSAIRSCLCVGSACVSTISSETMPCGRQITLRARYPIRRG